MDLVDDSLAEVAGEVIEGLNVDLKDPEVLHPHLKLLLRKQRQRQRRQPQLRQPLLKQLLLKLRLKLL